MAAFVRTLTLTAGINGTKAVKRGVFKTTDGYWVSVIVDTAAFYVYVSTDGVTWTLSRTVATDWNTVENIPLSACIDVNNGLHVAYRLHTNNVNYSMFTWSGTSYNAPTTRTLYTSVANKTVRAIDLDTSGTTNHRHSVVGVYISDTVAGDTFINWYVVDDNAGTVQSLVNNMLGVGKKIYEYTSGFNSADISVACVKVGAAQTNTTVQWAYTATKNWTTGDLGDVIGTETFTVAGSTFAAGPSIAISSVGKGTGRRQYHIFCDNGAKIFRVGGSGGTDYWYAYQFEFTNSTTVTPLGSQSINSANHSGKLAIAQLYGSQSYYGNRIYYYGVTISRKPYLYQVATFNSDNSISWYTTANPYDDSLDDYTLLTQVVASPNRNFDQRLMINIYIDGVSGTGLDNYRVLSRPIQYGDSGTLTKPVAASTSPTSFPLLEAKYKIHNNLPQIRYKMTFQIATDSAFTAGVQQFTQDDSKLVVPINTATGGADVRASLTPPTRIASGVWYIRAAAVDDAGNVGAWSPGVSFTVLHRPQASGLAPDNDSILPYGSGSVFFSWTFTDPSSGDAQTAYEVIVSRRSDGASVVDSGIVASATNGGAVAIPSASKDTELQWQVFVYDTDGTVASPGSALATFFVSDPPVPNVTAPTNGQVLANGRPTVTWTSGVTGTKTQKSYRVVITQGSTTIFDSGTILGTSLSYQIPPGYLHNLNSYTVKVTVTDSLGQTGSSSKSFSTSYTVPAAPTGLRTYLYEFNRYGFVYVGWDSSAVDVNFTSWNVYRQEIGQPSAIQIAQFSEVRPVYGFRDYAAKANTRYRYWVTQMVNRFGDIVESLPSAVASFTTPSGQYWILDGIGIADPVPLFNITADGWTDEHEENISNVLGKGRHVDIGTDLGANGSLSGQLRDKYVGIDLGNNWAPNPAFQYATDGINPDGWTLTYGAGVVGPTTRYDTPIEPAPCAKANVFTIGVDSAPAGFSGGANAVIFTQNDYLPIADTDLIAGTSTDTIAFWVAQPPANSPALEVRLYVYFYDASKVFVLNTGALATLAETYEPSNTLDSAFGTWKRYTVNNMLVPAGSVYYRMQAQINGVVAISNALFFLGGISLNTGATPKSYFDGDMRGAGWVSTIGGTSYSFGTYSARQQRLDIENMKGLNRPVYLRSPFGDMLKCHIGDEANSRQAGIGGGMDADDITLPYSEISY